MKLGSIQFLRALAAILVVYAYSIDLTMSFGEVQNFHYLSEIGFIGQDLFFVISGFIITYVAGKYSGFDEGVLFIHRRFFRINFLYYMASTLYIGCHLLHVWYTAHMLPMPMSMILNSLADTLLIVPTAADMSEYRPLLLNGWVLAFGWWFYVLFFIVIVVKAKRKILLLSSILILLAGIGYLIKPTDLRLSFLANPILLEFLLGIIICQLYLQLRKILTFLSAGLVLASIGWFIFLVFYGYDVISVDRAILEGTWSMQRVLLWGIPTGCLVAGCVFLERESKVTRLWSNHIVRLIGDSSFSIYLMHLPVFSLLALLYRKTGLRLPGDTGIIIQVIVAVLIGIVFYRWIEKPLLRWQNKASKKIMINAPTQPQTL